MRALRRIFAAIGLVSFMIALTVPLFFYVNVPCQDDWTLVPIVGHILDGKASFMDFWAFQSEHRIFFPRLFLCHWAAWSHWNMGFIPWLNLALVLLTTFFIYRLSGVAERPFWKNAFFWAPCALTFSLHAVKTVVWVIQFHTFLTVALCVMAVTVVAKDPSSMRRWLAAIALSMAATFSFGEGMIIWFAMLPLLASARISTRSSMISALWIGSAALSLAFYFHGFPFFHSHPSYSFVAHDPLYTAHFFLAYLGALFYPLPAGLFGGLGLFLAALLALDAAGANKADRPVKSGLFCVVLFVLGNALTTSLSRSHYSLEGAVVDRYVPLSCYLWACLGVWMMRFGKLRNGLYLFLIGCVLSTASFHWKDYQGNKLFMDSARDILKEEPLDPEKVRTLFSDEQLVQDSVATLKEHKLSVFSSVRRP